MSNCKHKILLLEDGKEVHQACDKLLSEGSEYCDTHRCSIIEVNRCNRAVTEWGNNTRSTYCDGHRCQYGKGELCHRQSMGDGCSFCGEHELEELYKKAKNEGKVVEAVLILALIDKNKEKEADSKKEKFKDARDDHNYYFTILGLLLTSTTFVLTSNNTCCGVRYLYSSALLLTLIGIFGIACAGWSNFADYKGDWKLEHILMHLIIILIVTMTIIGMGLWLSSTMNVCTSCSF